MKKRRGKWTRGVLSCKIMHQPTPLFAVVAATKCSFKFIPHPPCSPDLAPLDLDLFPSLKTNLHSRYFGSNEGVIDAVDE